MKLFKFVPIAVILAAFVYAFLSFLVMVWHSGTSRYDTPLIAAVDAKNLSAAKSLIERGIDVNAQGPRNEGGTALTFAVNGDEVAVELVTLLLSHGANPNIADYTGRTPLHIAALDNRDDIARILLAHGANVNARDKAGNTPLSYARATASGEAVVVVLKAAGATK